ncbi:hypothetical protein B0H17DRAFT_1135378 [Mycena rosella]|uniref:Bromo domain-containing protein n=1 Tax=Mycena rosella TaxID=1033263 RepID=A0AAD7GFN0_MYCRO|nr:hypothetical protein B0H17DRAFT_1135378 [Mycena rosella]
MEEGYNDNPSSENHPDWDYSIRQPLEFDEFKHEIDTRGGFYQSLDEAALTIEDFEGDLSLARDQEKVSTYGVQAAYAAEKLVMLQYLPLNMLEEEGLLLDIELRDNPDKREPYPEGHCMEAGKNQDERLKPFFLSTNGKLYKHGDGSTHKLVVAKEHRMYMMRASHNALGHRGLFATKALIDLRFWWPEMERDVDQSDHGAAS